MIQQVMALYDSKARCYAAPFFVAHTDVALRVFAQVANDPANQISHAPQDFTLFHLGTYDDNTGVIQPFTQQVNMGLASQFRKTVVLNEDKLFQGR